LVYSKECDRGVIITRAATSSTRPRPKDPIRWNCPEFLNSRKCGRDSLILALPMKTFQAVTLETDSAPTTPAINGLQLVSLAGERRSCHDRGLRSPRFPGDVTEHRVRVAINAVGLEGWNEDATILSERRLGNLIDGDDHLGHYRLHPAVALMLIHFLNRPKGTRDRPFGRSPSLYSRPTTDFRRPASPGRGLRLSTSLPVRSDEPRPRRCPAAPRSPSGTHPASAVR
jgi:hypothetical protein